MGLNEVGSQSLQMAHRNLDNTFSKFFKKDGIKLKSNNYKKQKAKVQNLHTKIYNQRKEYLHKISNKITNQYDIVCVETLNVKGMIRNRHLSKSIADVAWSGIYKTT